MSSFRYQAIQLDGAPVQGVIEAEDRRAALRLLSERGLYPSNLEACGDAAVSRRSGNGAGRVAPAKLKAAKAPTPAEAGTVRRGGSIKRKQITSFTREMSALLGASIPIPQALDSLGEEEEHPVLRQVILRIAESVRKGASLSGAMEEHSRHFSRLYCSMVKVGEEAGALPKVMGELADLLEHEDEVRGEVTAAVAYPVFVLASGVVTVVLLLAVVMPRLFTMLREMLPVLPLPTLVLLEISGFLQRYWPWVLVAVVAAVVGWRRFVRTPHGATMWDAFKLRIPLIGPVFRSAALGRFARTLGTLARSGVSLLPALRIVEDTIGNRVLAAQISQVAEETRGGDSLAMPLRKLGVFPRAVVQMIEVGEETGRLDDMLLKVAEIEERHMRARTKTLVSLLGPFLILVVGALVGFIVIALLLPIFRMSSAMQ